MIICGTGHRSNKLGGYSYAVFSRLVALAEAALKRYQPEKVISGMALGWDQALAQAAVNLNIPLVAAIPFKGQENMWPEASKKKYEELLSHAGVVVVSSGNYAPAKMETRNEWMVDRSDLVLALWNGTSGGTCNCVRYAYQKQKRVINLWKTWETHR